MAIAWLAQILRDRIIAAVRVGAVIALLVLCHS
jgi:hypothetical protein